MKISNVHNEEIKITCPACGLMCGDIVLNPQSHLPENTNCPRSFHFYKQVYLSNTSSNPCLSGKPTDIHSAIKAAADMLSASKQPLFAGLGTEVQGMRSVLRLAEKVGATLDHMHSEGGMRNTLVLQNSGWQNTTLTEVKNRADVILAIGTDIVSSHPLFFEKLVWNENSLFDKPVPEIIYLGLPENTPPENLKAGVSPTGKAPTLINVDTEELPEIINVLNALMNNKKVQSQQVAGVSITQLQKVLNQLKAAQYAVITWAAENFKYQHAELTIQGITQLVSKLNETSRAAGLPLNTGDGDISVNNASTWLTGYPTRNRFSRDKTEFNADLFSTKNQLKSCDGLLWVSTFNAHLPPSSDVPTIVIGHPNMKFERMPKVFIPVGIPGIDHIGTMFRMDNVIALPLPKIRETSLLSLSQVIQKILDCMP